MSKGILSPHGLKYTISEDVYEEIQEVDHGTNAVWQKINQVVEGSELLPSCVSFLTFVFCSLQNNMQWFMPALISLGGYVLATILANMLFVVDNLISRLIIFVYQMFSRFLLNYVTIIGIAVFITKDWKGAVLFIIGIMILSMTLTFAIGGYEQREITNNRFARAILKKFR